MQLRSVSITETPTDEVLYLKTWQSNGFYPLYIAEKTSDNKWRVFVDKNGRKSGMRILTDTEFLFMLQNNLYLVSSNPMHNDREFNFE